MEKLKVAVPNKGRLSEASIGLIDRAGINIINHKDRVLYTSSQDGNYTIVFLRTQDIPSFVSQGVVDIGITGKDIVVESKEDVDIIHDLNFGYCKVIVAVSEDSNINSVDDIPDGTKVATSFVNIAKDYFEKKGKKLEIIEISGATEVSPQLGLAKIIVDITSTGSTLKVNKLKIIDEIFHSHSCIIANKNIVQKAKNELDMFCMAINSVMTAQQQKYLMANIPKSALEEVKAFMPGLSSPTIVSLLDKSDEVAIHAVVPKDKVYATIKNLKSIGGNGILILALDQMIS